ncbi:MAG: hypothetical protein ACFFC7_14415 [Candidatus Hermodarchaeota archaeon]
MFRDRKFRNHYSPRYPMPMSKKAFNEMRRLFLLKILKENKKGITGYQLQEEYRFPRTNVVRLLDKLLEDEYVEVKETTVDGRAHKLFFISQKGEQLLDDLQEKWSDSLANMSDMVPFRHPFRGEKRRFRFMRKIDEMSSKEDVIDLLRGHRSRIKNRQKRLEMRLQYIADLRKNLDDLIEFTEKMDEFDKEKLKQKIREIRTNEIDDE